MKKWIAWIGIVIFVFAAVCFFLSGSSSGPSPTESTPTVPLIYGTNQIVWIFLGALGLVLMLLGLFARKKKGKNKAKEEDEESEEDEEEDEEEPEE